MNRALITLVIAIVALSTLVSAGPTLIGLVHALVPLVLAMGGVVAMLRLLWHFTGRY
jgi:hypothetical protein